MCLGQTHGDVRPVCELSNFDVLLGTGTVVVGVGDGSPEIQVGDLLEDRLVELSGLAGISVLDGECRGGRHGGDNKSSGDLPVGL